MSLLGISFLKIHISGLKYFLSLLKTVLYVPTDFLFCCISIGRKHSGGIIE